MRQVEVYSWPERPRTLPPGRVGQVVQAQCPAGLMRGLAPPAASGELQMGSGCREGLITHRGIVPLHGPTQGRRATTVHCPEHVGGKPEPGRPSTCPLWEDTPLQSQPRAGQPRWRPRSSVMGTYDCLVPVSVPTAACREGAGRRYPYSPDLFFRV